MTCWQRHLKSDGHMQMHGGWLSFVLRWHSWYNFYSYLTLMTVPCLKRNSIFRQRTGSAWGEAHWAFIDALQQVLPPRGERESLVGGQLWSVPATDKLPGKLHGLPLPHPLPGMEHVVSMLYQHLRLSYIINIECPKKLGISHGNVSWECYIL